MMMSQVSEFPLATTKLFTRSGPLLFLSISQNFPVLSSAQRAMMRDGSHAAWDDQAPRVTKAADISAISFLCACHFVFVRTLGLLLQDEVPFRVPTDVPLAGPGKVPDLAFDLPMIRSLGGPCSRSEMMER